MAKPGPDANKSNEELISELTQMRQQMARMKSLVDSGVVHNHTYFQERLAEEVSRSSRYKYDFSIVIMEADNFEAYTGKCGNEAGDEWVGMLKTILRNALRLSDLCCHFKNTRFGLLLPYTNSDGAGIVTGRIIQTSERVMALKGMSLKIPLTMSAGIASFPKDAVSQLALADLAGGALKQAKLKGGNCYCYAGAGEKDTDSTGSAIPEQPGNEALVESLNIEMQRSSRYSTELALMMVSFSEQAQGGELIPLLDKKRVADIITRYILGCIRGTDRPFPYNVNQLALLLPSTNAVGAEVLAAKLLKSIEGDAGLNPAGKNTRPLLNIGIASFPIDEVSHTGLIKCAEAALVLAARKGGNQVMLASGLSLPEKGNQRDVAALIKSLKEIGQNSIYNLLAVVDATEHYVIPHSQNVAKLSMAIGQVLGLYPVDIGKLRVMALLHDVGKIYLAPVIITKPGPLDDKELAIMRRHPEFGADIVKQFTDFAHASKAILAHHERIDGQGYPAGLAGEKIPLESRIIAVAEAYDDMVIGRPYREQFSTREAMQELGRNAGSQFDAAVVNALKKALSNAAGG